MRADGGQTIVVVPTDRERRSVLRSLVGARPEAGLGVPAWRAGGLLMVETGIGPARITACLPRLERRRSRAVWLFGWCGGLQPELRAGDRVLGVETLPLRGEGEVLRRIGHPPPEGLEQAIRGALEADGRRFVAGSVLSSPVVLRSREEKRRGAATGAVAVEMEAGSLAGWAVERSIPFVHLRVVLDPLDSALPASDLEVNARGRVNGFSLLRAAGAHPGEWRRWWRLARQVRAAERSMAEAMAALTRPGAPLDPARGAGLAPGGRRFHASWGRRRRRGGESRDLEWGGP